MEKLTGKQVRKFIVEIYGVSGKYIYEVEGFNRESVIEFVRMSILPKLKARGLVA
jgi:hypothetical protein